MHDWVGEGSNKLQLFGCVLLNDIKLTNLGVIYQTVKYRVPPPPTVSWRKRTIITIPKENLKFQEYFDVLNLWLHFRIRPLLSR